MDDFIRNITFSYIVHVTPDDLKDIAGEFAMFDCEIAVKLRAVGLGDAREKVKQLLYSKVVRGIAADKIRRGE